MERHAVDSGVTEGQMRAARDRLLATYRNAIQQSAATPVVERMVLRSAVAANSAAAAHQLATHWSADMAEPMDQFANAVKRDDLLSRSMWPGGAILLAHLGIAKVVLAILLGIISWLLRASALPEAVQLIICLLLLAGVVYLLAGPIFPDGKADEVDSRISQLLDPAQREFFRLVDGSPPVMEPAKLVKTNVGAAARLLLLGFVALILTPLVASVVSIVQSLLSTRA
jgi:hypothetical protein